MPFGLLWRGDALLPDGDGDPWAALLLASRDWTIGGATGIRRNMVAHKVIGLPCAPEPVAG